SPVKVAGYSFEPETTLIPVPYLVHYREDLYPNPQLFDPDRFLKHQYSSSEYFPFGGGSRWCLGYALAQLELKLIIAHILSNYQLTLAEDQPLKLKRHGFSLSPQGGVKMVMRGKK
ncbi:MAG: cytochrome P450, partial [Symploca sp. SIO2D2]|nr:cytochrome P450 [Symploca sp. SIO2D2]